MLAKSRFGFQYSNSSESTRRACVSAMMDCADQLEKTITGCSAENRYSSLLSCFVTSFADFL